jgi:S-adenosylmethionine:tRNA ribosyltransferase-isomerase
MAVVMHRPIEFTVPPEREAHEPPEARGLARDEVRLMVTGRRTGEIVHARARDLPAFLRSGDLLVLNVSATLPAAVTVRRPDGRTIALHLSTGLAADLWVVEPRTPSTAAGASGNGSTSPRAPSIAPGEALSLPGNGRATMLIPYRRSRRLWVAHLDLPAPPLEYLARWGRPISYPYVPEPWPLAMYQTVYAEVPGSAEMPSAGRALTGGILHRLREKGVGIAKLVLHTGVASLERDEPPYEEFYHVPAETAEAIQIARVIGGRVIAVGTTVVRALETSVDATGRVIASRGWTDLVVTPERGVRVVAGLLTGFHEPRASHWAMLEAIADPHVLERSYREALAAGYLWHEFGDLQLLV